MSSSICFLGADDRDVLDVRLELGRDERDDLVDLRLVDPGSLDAQLARAHREEECVALPMNSAPGWSRTTRESASWLVANAMREGTLALMSPVTTSTEGRWVARTRWILAARASCGDAHDRLLDVARGDHHQVGELVDDDEKIGVGRRLPLRPGQRPPSRPAPPC